MRLSGLAEEKGRKVVVKESETRTPPRGGDGPRGTPGVGPIKIHTRQEVEEATLEVEVKGHLFPIKDELSSAVF